MSARPPPPPRRPVKARRRTTNPCIAGGPAAPAESSSGRVAGASPPPVSPIDVEAIEDDDVELLSSPRGFLQARRRRRRPVTVDLEEEEVEVNPGRSGGPTDEPVIVFSLNTRNKRERIPSNRTVINCETSLNCEDHYDPKRKKVVESPPVPPKEATFTCPICMSKLVQASSTTCGHIFCHSCIKESIRSHKKCPMCAQKLTPKSFHRVYLPSTE